MEKEIPQIFFLRPGKDEGCLRIELLGRNHGSEGVEISVHMRGDDLFVRRCGRVRPLDLFFFFPLHKKIIS